MGPSRPEFLVFIKQALLATPAPSSVLATCLQEEEGGHGIQATYFILKMQILLQPLGDVRKWSGGAAA